MSGLLTEEELTQRVEDFKKFQTHWTLEKIKNMTLEEYTKLGSKDTFTYNMEWKLKFVPMGGGNSFKFGIYQYRNNPTIKYWGINNVYYETKTDGKYAWISYYGETANEAFEKIKQIIVSIIEFTQNGQIDKIEEIQDFMHNYKWKIAFYFQNPNNPLVFGIVADYALQSIAQNQFGKANLKTSEIYSQIFAKEGKPTSIEDLFQFTRRMWLVYSSEDEYQTIYNKIGQSTNEMQNISTSNNINQPLNHILYGPPGTGKTYHTINKALEIISQKDQSIDEELRAEIKDILENLKSDSPTPENRKRAKEIFDNLKEQIEFVTFHQSYSYEEFVEGIKPIPTEEKNVNYELQDGIFKKLCHKANENLVRSKIDEDEKIKIEEQNQQNIMDFCESIHETILEKGKYDLGDGVNIQETTFDKYGKIRSFILGGSVTSRQSLAVNMLQRDYADIVNKKIESPKDIKAKYKSNREHHGNAGYYLKLYKKLENFLKNRELTLVQSEPLKPYILIIDEINRGNISKIFGELITLIEPSKRIGASEELKIRLPYSGISDKPLFGVPSNLYIIGTMNTADRSITSIDTALRRRFEFEEMMPNPSKLKILEIEGENEEGKTEINLKEMLKAINERIEYLCGREKTIGHAYLIEVDSLQSLKNNFQNKIIPLLQEYFYNDYEAINAVLNDNGMIRNNQDFKYTQGSFKTFTDNRGMNEKKIFRIATETDKNEGSKKCVWEDTDTYIAIYDDEVSQKLKKAKS